MPFQIDSNGFLSLGAKDKGPGKGRSSHNECQRLTHRCDRDNDLEAEQFAGYAPKSGGAEASRRSPRGGTPHGRGQVSVSEWVRARLEPDKVVRGADRNKTYNTKQWNRRSRKCRGRLGNFLDAGAGLLDAPGFGLQRQSVRRPPPAVG